MKILFLGDPHLKINNFEQSKAFLKWSEEVAEKYKPDVVCNLGDTFDTHGVVRAELLKEFQDHVARLTSSGFQYWYVLGNHDQFKPKDSKYHALQTISMDNFHLFDKITELDGITIVPYIMKYEDFPLQTQSICITHNTFIGTDYGFKREDCGVNADNVTADIIISGHIHKRQQFGKVVYPGTPYAHNASDVDQTKGVLLFDTATFAQEFVESPFLKWRSIEFEVNSINTIKNLHSTLTTELNDQDKWIIKVSGPKIELSAYFKSEDFLDLIKNKKVTTKVTPTDKVKQKVKIKATSIEDIMSEYVEKVYDGNLDKQLILRKINDIITNIK